MINLCYVNFISVRNNACNTEGIIIIIITMENNVSQISLSLKNLDYERKKISRLKCKARWFNLGNMFLSSLFSLSDYVWPLPRYLCPVWISLDVLFSTASIMHLCAISLDRYVAIRNPIEHSRFNSRTKAIMKIAIVWAISIGK